jgi:hypothetical protein
MRHFNAVSNHFYVVISVSYTVGEDIHGVIADRESVFSIDQQLRPAKNFLS